MGSMDVPLRHGVVRTPFRHRSKRLDRFSTLRNRSSSACGERKNQVTVAPRGVIGAVMPAPSPPRRSRRRIATADVSGGGRRRCGERRPVGSPKALKLYGIPPEAYSGDDEMFDLVHEMRRRIITSPSFNGDRILGAILFEMTMDREIEGHGSADYLWSVKHVVPFLKVDKGLLDEADGVQVMKPIAGLDDLLARARSRRACSARRCAR